MRYIAKERENSKNGIVTIIDSNPEHRWDSEEVTVYNLDKKKNKKSDMILKALNLRDELSKKLPSKRTKSELVEIINKYL